jgi:threonine/homoserine/homoserine lactone efflux protein
LSIETWIAYAMACVALLLIPGPTLMVVVAQALARGPRVAIAAVPGVALGDLTAMSVSLAGAGAVLAASAALFTALKLLGAAYLVWLGSRLWRSPPAALTLTADRQGRDLGGVFFQCFAVTALNPKGILFFVAFVPQFIDPSQPLAPQVAVLMGTFVGLAAVHSLTWSLLAGSLRTRVSRPGTQRLIQRAGGSAMIGAGVLTALARPS